MHAREQFYYVVLHGVGILKLVHEHVLETVGKILAYLRIPAQKTPCIQQKVVKVQRIVLFEVLFVAAVYAHIVVHLVLVGVLARILVGFKAEHLCVAYVELGGFKQLIVVIVQLF